MGCVRLWVSSDFDVTLVENELNGYIERRPENASLGPSPFPR